MFLDAEERIRPDLEVEFADATSKMTTYALDLTIVCPFTGSQKGSLGLPTQVQTRPQDCDHQADQAAKEKDRKYKDFCKQRNVTFVPFVMYTTGKLHSTAYRFLKSMSTYVGERRKIPPSVLLRYYLKILSVNLIRRIGYTIRVKSDACLSGTLRIREAIRDGNERALQIGGTYQRRGGRH